MSNIFLYLFVTTFLIQSFYWIGIFGHWAFSNVAEEKEYLPPEPISVIICAKNEAENLKKNLPEILNQHYPVGFEVIVVNDHSTDNSFEILTELKKQFKNLCVFDLEENKTNWRGKKNALNEGIKSANNEWLLLTDADCKPESNQWLLTMQRARKKNTEIVLGYSPYSIESSFLNKVIQFETLLTAVQYFSYCHIGVPYMGVGRNLMYKKSLYEQFSFEKIGHVVSGDDDLLIGMMATEKNTSYCLNRLSYMISIPKVTWKDWYRQKTRHLSTGIYYKPKIQILLGLYSLSQSLYFFSFFLLLFYSIFTPLLIVLLFARTFFVSIILHKVKLNISFTTVRLSYLVFLEFFFVLYYFIFSQSLWKKSTPPHW